MTDSPRRGREEQSGFRAREDSAQPYGYSGYSDPAYASQTPYGPTYQTPSAPAPTERFPEHSTYGYDPYATGQYGGQYGGQSGEPPPPEEPKSPRWLWVAAGIAVVAVVGLVIALVIVNSSTQRTVVAPSPDSTFSPSETSKAPTTTRTPSIPLPLPTTTPGSPPTSGTTAPGGTQTVLYDVQGDGRAINITYVDTGGILQTEFNVTLPWSKEVQLNKPAAGTASVSVINVGPQVNCSISVDGAVVQQRSGAGLTICTGSG
jgi:hypothetical protein